MEYTYLYVYIYIYICIIQESETIINFEIQELKLKSNEWVTYTEKHPFIPMFESVSVITLQNLTPGIYIYIYIYI